MTESQADLKDLNKKGFVVLNDILDPKKIETARRRFEELFEDDLSSRRDNGFQEAHYPNGPCGYTILTPASHLMLNVFAKNPGFDALVEEVLENPRVNNLIKSWSGPRFRIGSCNIRYMTGAYDPPP